MAAALLDALLDPGRAARLDAASWDLVLRQARAEKLHARIAAKLLDRGLLEKVVEPVRARLLAYATMSDTHDRGARWEVDRIAAALAGVDTPVVLLKGAAYLMSLPVARGRLADDVDILVPKDRIGAIEEALLAHGWQPLKVDPYDQKYYRRWMHELPPLRHARRHSTIDVHHTILPETSRLRPGAENAVQVLRASAGLDILRNNQLVDPQRIAAIGYCSGGTTVLELAYAGAKVAGVASFHGGLTAPKPEDEGRIKAKVLVLHGADDGFISPDAITAFQDGMRKAGADLQMVYFGGTVHSFTNPGVDKVGIKGIAYNPKADARSLGYLQVFFKEIFK